MASKRGEPERRVGWKRAERRTDRHERKDDSPVFHKPLDAKKSKRTNVPLSETRGKSPQARLVEKKKSRKHPPEGGEKDFT